MAKGTEEKEIKEYKKYNSFEELYKDYKDIIDTEFSQRHIYRLKQLKDSIENREKWMQAHIMQDDGRSNQYYREKAELLEEVYDIVEKELNIPLPFESAIDDKIREIKNKIVDELFTGRIEDYRGRGHEYELALKRAGRLADIIEYAIKGFIYPKEIYNNDNLIAIINFGKKENYHKDKVLRMVEETINQRDFLKMIAKLK